MNTGAPWPDLDEAEHRVLVMQTKLHQWAKADPGRRFDDLANLVYDPAFLVAAWARVRGNKGAGAALGAVQSMGRVGSALDNAAADSFNSTLEHEVLLRRASRPPQPRSGMTVGPRETPEAVRYDSVMIVCPVCGRTFDPVGRRRYCSDACRQAAYRRRLDRPPPPPVPARPVVVYECDGCGQRLLGHQRCEECATFMRRIGIGGHCPSCDEPVAIDELTSP